VHFVKPDEQLGAELAPRISSATLRTAELSSAAFWGKRGSRLKAGDVVWREAEGTPPKALDQRRQTPSEATERPAAGSGRPKSPGQSHRSGLHSPGIVPDLPGCVAVWRHDRGVRA
jgi:hypothetical protein